MRVTSDQRVEERKIGKNSQNFHTTIALTPGSQEYQGQFQAPLNFLLPDNGTYAGKLKFDFPQPTAKRLALSAPAPGTLDFTINQINFQLAPTAAAVPEPSSLAFLAIGVAALGLVSRRRRLA